MKTLDICDKFKMYDCSSVISEEQENTAYQYLIDQMDNGKYITHCFGRQNIGCLFKHHGSVWDSYKKSFLNSVAGYLDKEINPIEFFAWCYITNEDLQGNRDRLWNLHWTPDGTDRKWISGLYYLKVQRDYNCSGTEFTIADINNDSDKFYTETLEKHWTIFPSDLWHRPGIALGKEWRIIIAADLLYLDQN